MLHGGSIFEREELGWCDALGVNGRGRALWGALCGVCVQNSLTATRGYSTARVEGSSLAAAASAAAAAAAAFAFASSISCMRLSTT